MAVTLIDYLKLAESRKDMLGKGFCLDLLRYSDLIGIVPLRSVDGLQIGGTRWQTLPSAAFRKIGGGYTESTGNHENIVETLSILGGDVKVDRVLTKVKNVIRDPLQEQMDMKAKSVAFTFNNYLINGDQSVDPDGFEGLKKRVANMPARQSIYLDTNALNTGTSLKVLASAANEQTFIDALHQAIKYCDGATHFLCNESTFLGIGKVLRRLGLLETTTDAYGKTWDAFAKVPFIDVGLKADKTTEIITSTEGTDTVSTSIYAVRFDTGDGVHGLQLNGTSPLPYDPLGGEMEAGPQFLRRIDWTVGLANLSQYCVVRVGGFKMAAS